MSEPTPTRPCPTRRLYLLRHAKSSWAEATLADHERPLSPRGVRAAERMCRWLDENDVTPDLVLCSTAVRARYTLERVLPALGTPRVLVETALYHASCDILLQRVRALPDDVGAAMLVGHNPGFEELVGLLAAPAELRDEAMQKFPTGALATLESAGHWPELHPGAMSLTALVLPRRLEP